MELFANCWPEKYRPKTLNDIVLTPENMQYFAQIKEKGECPNLMFFGPPGMGKTSLAHILVKNILDCQYIYINASEETGIDVIRSKVINFAQTRSIDGKIKIVILDECLHEDTLVWIIRDGKNIKEKIKNLHDDTDLVMSYDTENKQIVWRPFELYDKGERVLYEVVLQNGEIVKCTDTHKWYVKYNGTIQVMQLKDIIKNKINHILSP
jgi:DNA helicase TIP49 (TBP-interacting protein)